MPESMESKQTESRARVKQAAFVPRTMGIFILLIIVLAFIAGAVRRELALTLTGAVFLVLWVYCLLMTLILALIHRRRSRRVSIRISPREIAAGRSTEILYSEGEGMSRAMFQVPGIVIRCRLLLSTADGRRVTHDFDPAVDLSKIVTIYKRGAYFSTHDEFAVFDILGFFRFAWLIPAESGARLLASPPAADEAPAINARAGDSNQKPEFSFQRTDNLIDHRPYVPGDDPRRINWKLYGHGGELFVREGEREPPPHSNIIILIDTQFDPLLYSIEAARNGIDLLCENALAAALACVESGMDVLTGFSGGAIRGGNAAELSTALAWPAALPLSSPLDMPAAPADRGVVIFALPRSSAEPSALDRFLQAQANR
ncbi:MAG: DUF58 domain-containing protein, partial [Treponema sp.]|nr:DUF58 domain-containing protein [Treponema sp.]